AWLDNWGAPDIYWCAPVAFQRNITAPAGGSPLRPKASDLGVTMRLQRTAMPAGQSCAPAASAEVSTLVAASGQSARGRSTGRRPGGRGQDAQVRPAPEFPTRLSRRAEDRGVPGSGRGRTGRDGPGRWLTVSMVSLAVLAAASAAVSYAAQ